MKELGMDYDVDQMNSTPYNPFEVDNDLNYTCTQTKVKSILK